jgi:hypothetical protein
MATMAQTRSRLGRWLLGRWSEVSTGRCGIADPQALTSGEPTREMALLIAEATPELCAGTGSSCGRRWPGWSGHRSPRFTEPVGSVALGKVPPSAAIVLTRMECSCPIPPRAGLTWG